IGDNIVTSDDKFAAMYGIDPLRAGLGVPIEAFMEAIHADDRAHVQQDIAVVLANASPLQSEYRLISADGSIRWVIASGSPRLDAEGRPVRLPGVVVDITEQRRISEA